MIEAELDKKWENTVWDTDVYLDDIDGKEPMTNEEWLRCATTEELEEEILAWWVDGADTYTQFGLFQHEIDGAKEKIVEWLKQPHKPKE